MSYIDSSKKRGCSFNDKNNVNGNEKIQSPLQSHRLTQELSDIIS